MKLGRTEDAIRGLRLKDYPWRRPIAVPEIEMKQFPPNGRTVAIAGCAIALLPVLGVGAWFLFS